MIAFILVLFSFLSFKTNVFAVKLWTTMEIQIDKLTIELGASSFEDVPIDFNPSERQFKFTCPFPPEKTRIPVEGSPESFTYSIGRIEIRMAEEFVRRLAANLPPEILH
jgi:hypothetical protein